MRGIDRLFLILLTEKKGRSKRDARSLGIPVHTFYLPLYCDIHGEFIAHHIALFSIKGIDGFKVGKEILPVTLIDIKQSRMPNLEMTVLIIKGVRPEVSEIALYFAMIPFLCIFILA